MTARLLERYRARVEFRRATSMLHPECPIEQALHSRDPAVQEQLLQEIWGRQAYADDGALLVADPKALRVLGRTEAALRPPLDALRERYGEALVAEPPSVRYAHGAPVLEPYMAMLLCGPEQHLAPLQHDLARRRGHVRRLDRHSGLFVLEGEAPLANLLGYDAWLGERFERCTDLSMWLCRYAPIDDDGPRAA
jgi:hypothetical protein